MEPQINPISSTGKWIVELKNNGYDIDRVKNKFLRIVPYGVLSEVSEYIQENWTAWSSEANTLSMQMQKKNVTDAKNFIRCMSSPTSQYKITHMLELAQKIHGVHHKVKDILSVKVDRETVLKLEIHRIKANKDHSNGFMRDLAKKTLSVLAIKIGDNKNWKLLYDAIGFDADTCHKCESPENMLELWMISEKMLPVERLCFEARQLYMKGINSYLNTIPLKGSCSVPMFTINPDELMPRKVTKWDIKQIDKISSPEFKWCNILDSLLKNEEKPYSPNHLWRSGDILLEDLFLYCENSSSIRKFKDQVNSGDFELKSTGGISYAEICYLSQATNEDALKAEYNMGLPNDFSLKNHLKARHDIPNIDFGTFLCLYWQDSNLGELLYLDTFCSNIIKILQQEGASHVAAKFEKLYLDIRPFRHHPNIEQEIFNRINQHQSCAKEEIQNEEIHKKIDEQIYTNQTNKKQIETKEVAKNVQSFAGLSFKDNAMEIIKIHNESVADNPFTCKICFEKEINVIPLCGHFAYCLDCINLLNNCSYCSKPIKQKITIYRV